MKTIGILIFFLTLAFTPALADKGKTVNPAEPPLETAKDNPESKTPSPTQTVELDWYSINSGGASYGTSGTLKLGYSIGQSVAGAGSSGSLKMGAGFWYGHGIYCVAKAGDLTGDGTVLLPDIVALINYRFRSGPTPVPFCRGDANGDGVIQLTDIVYLINYRFRSGPAPVKTGVCCL